MTRVAFARLHPPAPQIPDADTAFASADTDGDGFLSEEEFAAQVTESACACSYMVS